MEAKIQVAYPTAKVISGFQPLVTLESPQTNACFSCVWHMKYYQTYGEQDETSQPRFTGKDFVPFPSLDGLVAIRHQTNKTYICRKECNHQPTKFQWQCPLAILAGHRKSTNHIHAWIKIARILVCKRFFPLANVIGLNQAQGSYRWDVSRSKLLRKQASR